ncbi:MAG: DUF2798 domain-containing protein [Spirochaetes bacterium]|nr:DUF2798 domain-containing protein [Spirochaetota bacterium]
MKKFPKIIAPVLFAFIMALLMPFIMTFFIVLITAGWSDLFFIRWMKAYGIAFVIAFPAILLLAPLVRKIVAALTEA